MIKLMFSLQTHILIVEACIMTKTLIFMDDISLYKANTHDSGFFKLCKLHAFWQAHFDRAPCYKAQIQIVEACV